MGYFLVSYRGQVSVKHSQEMPRRRPLRFSTERGVFIESQVSFQARALVGSLVWEFGFFASLSHRLLCMRSKISRSENATAIKPRLLWNWNSQAFCSYRCGFQFWCGLSHVQHELKVAASRSKQVEILSKIGSSSCIEGCPAGCGSLWHCAPQPCF